VWVWATRVDRDRAFFSLPDFLEQRRDAAALADLAAIANWGANLDGAGAPERLQGSRATANLLDVLQVRPAIGRGVAPADDDPAAAPVAMLSFPCGSGSSAATRRSSAAACGSATRRTKWSASCPRRF